MYKRVADGLRFPEGPIALADGSVVLVQIASGDLSRVHSDGRIERIAHLGGGPNGAAIGPGGLCYICNNGGFAWHDVPGEYLRPVGLPSDYAGGRIERVELTTGRSEILYTHCNGVALRGPNDIVFDSEGGFWFTDLGKISGRSMDRGSVFYARADGSLIREVIFPMTTPNGIGLSPDGHTLYVSETDTSRLWAFTITGEGEIAQAPWPSPHGGRIVFGAGGYDRFDSLAIEAGGNVCVASIVRGGVAVISPAGELVEFVETPVPYCTNIAFGGPDLSTAYLTLSGTGELLAVAWPRPGLRLSHQHSQR
ncbi:SMP-30/gluconolactonase/LRE family protein [Chelatococcus reniformis]|uniref:SMP-30/Gluconolactonase/LRE-like region domain-containing protein n=1 Tax=Chelatococcus reniformis TaxID=1494448 RepID=A0A916ULT2_9HYPH|nr:SMP-30/gluconolactonase/LRE family protein [Chelatococcus reniformis]GGC76672.1 hypothetical protein GCM10010994_38730 [Chelatococcus reniformis]